MSSIGIVNPSSIESLPLATLESTPVQTPSPGVTSNFGNPYTLLTAFLSVLIVFSFFAIVSYALRLYMNIILLKKWRWDDTMITIGFLFTLIYLSAAICAFLNGTGGVHPWNIHIDRVVTIYGLYTIITSNSPALGFVKLSFLIQFYFLFKPLRWLRLSCWIGGSIIAFVYLSLSILAFVLQSPWSGEDFFTAVLSWHYFVYVADLSIPIGIIGLATDLFVIILPIPAVMGLQLALRKKIGILLVFSLGLLAVIGSTMSLYYRVQVFQNAKLQDADTAFAAGYLIVWTQVELLAGITAMNMPVTHQFFVRKNIMQRIERGKLSMTIKSLLSKSSHTQLMQRDDIHALKHSFELDKIQHADERQDGT